MINRIILFLIFPSLIVAILLSISGIQSIPFDNTMWTIFKVVGDRFQGFALPPIPNIPRIPKIDYVGNINGGFILNALIFLVNMLSTVINGLVLLVNFVIAIVNFVIALVEYVAIFIWSFNDMRDILRNAQGLMVGVL